MADWAITAAPLAGSAHATVFIPAVRARDEDAATWGYGGTYVNPITGTKRWNATDNTIEEWNGSAWIVKRPSILGGGTGAATAADARTNLGIGTMGIQAANNVTITGGSISGVSFAGSLNANDLGAGTVPLARIVGLTVAQFASPNISQWTNNSGYLTAASALNPANLSAGAIPAGVTIDADKITSGIIAVARLGSGVADATKFLRGDGSWQVVAEQKILNIQHFQGQINNGNQQQTDVITDVGGVSRAYVIPMGCANSEGVNESFRLEFVDTTHIKATRNGAVGNLIYNCTIFQLSSVP